MQWWLNWDHVYVRSFWSSNGNRPWPSSSNLTWKSNFLNSELENCRCNKSTSVQARITKFTPLGLRSLLFLGGDRGTVLWSRLFHCLNLQHICWARQPKVIPCLISLFSYLWAHNHHISCGKIDQVLRSVDICNSPASPLPPYVLHLMSFLTADGHWGNRGETDSCYIIVSGLYRNSLHIGQNGDVILRGGTIYVSERDGDAYNCFVLIIFELNISIFGL